MEVTKASDRPSDTWTEILDYVMSGKYFVNSKVRISAFAALALERRSA